MGKMIANDYNRFAKKRKKEILEKENKAHRFVEKPMMKNLLKNLSGKKVLMLGCGTGEEVMLLKEFGATDIVGIDLSEESIKIARETYPLYNFIIGDMHNLPFEDNSFDFVYSSLVIHYSDNPEKVYQEVYRILKKDGFFLFSLGHPIRWCSEKITIDGKEFKLLGYQNSSVENKIYGNYNSFCKKDEYIECENMLFSLYIGSPSMHFKLLRKNGFQIEDFSESSCIDEAKNINYNYWYRYNELPQFMAFLSKKYI